MIRFRELLYPSLERELCTDLAPADAERALTGEVETRPWSWVGAQWTTKKFQGEVANGTFELQRIGSGRRSFHPYVRGTIRDNGVGSSILISFHFSPLVLVFFAIWLCLVGLPLLAPSEQHDARVLRIAMLAFTYLFATGTFHLEVARSQRELLRIFDASVVA